jgi:hypothetical protein
LVAYKRRSLAAESSDQAAHQGKSKGQPEREGRRKEKRLFFYTSEATILLKTKGRVSCKSPKETDFQAQIAPKCTPKSRFLPVRDPFSPRQGQTSEWLHGISKLFRQAETLWAQHSNEMQEMQKRC